MSLICVYGSLKQGFGNHGLLGDSTLVGRSILPSGFTMWSLGGFPCITIGGEGPVHIEVYDVSPATLSRLDGLEGHPNWYRRMPVDTEYGPAEIYVMPDNKYSNLQKVEDGNWNVGSRRYAA